MYRQPFKKEWPITQKYGEKITSNFHTGIDYGCPFGTSILASEDGIVMYAGWDKTGYGNVVIIRHKSNSTLYAHLSDIHVFVGEKVNRGSLIGHSGSTGNSTGPHLHFEARKIWNDYKSHFDPMLLPLSSVDDTVQEVPSKSANGLVDGKDLEIGEVIISCPSGAFGHSQNFDNKWAFDPGTKMEFTGDTCERNGLTFCKCLLTLWVASNDGETQILESIK